MSLDTYLPVGRGRYRIGKEPRSSADLYYFVPERRDHLRVGFEIVRRGSHGEPGYSDVMVCTPEHEPDSTEEGEYSIQAPDRRYRVIEFRSGARIKRFLALRQPGLGRFRFISAD
jgi:hypothetical protein